MATSKGSPEALGWSVPSTFGLSRGNPPYFDQTLRLDFNHQLLLRKLSFPA